MSKRFNRSLEGKAKDGIIQIKVVSDKLGEYVPYCNYKFHPGVLKENRALKCRQNNCKNYRKLYLYKVNSQIQEETDSCILNEQNSCFNDNNYENSFTTDILYKDQNLYKGENFINHVPKKQSRKGSHKNGWNKKMSRMWKHKFNL